MQEVIERPPEVDESLKVSALEEDQETYRPSSLDLAMDSSLPTDVTGEEAIYAPEYVTEVEEVWAPISDAAEASYANVSSGGGAVAPIAGGNVTYAFGVRNSRYSAGYHTGVDFGARLGQAVLAPMGGTVIAAGPAGAYGNRVEIRHADGKVSLLAHNSAVTVKVGQRVNTGQQVAKAGSTGMSFGVHVHWEVRNPSNRYGDVVNPMSWLNSARSSPAASRGGPPRGVTGLYNLARQVGFNPSEARIMAAIAMGESSGNPRAHNPNANTGDNSYGLWQINMLGGMGPERRRLFGIQSNEQLFDPLVNARAAMAIYRQQGFRAWSVYNNGSYRRWL